ncbi:hypothetical protein [Flavobacterium sp. W21_SRS_FM6]|uniref:hypothetical protein n=1 Tax=Flavobacterium sp. W21_SRS_FM6 TaxID=3240268 RepID=UPI003F932B12
MSTKAWVSNHDYGASLYQECSYDYTANEVNPNPATIQIANPTDFVISSEASNGVKVRSQLVVEIPAKRFDELARAWIKHRGIQIKP